MVKCVEHTNKELQTKQRKKLCLPNKLLYRITPARENVALVPGQYVKIKPAEQE